MIQITNKPILGTEQEKEVSNFSLKEKRRLLYFEVASSSYNDEKVAIVRNFFKYFTPTYVLMLLALVFYIAYVIDSPITSDAKGLPYLFALIIGLGVSIPVIYNGSTNSDKRLIFHSIINDEVPFDVKLSHPILLFKQVRVCFINKAFRVLGPLLVKSCSSERDKVNALLVYENNSYAKITVTYMYLTAHGQHLLDKVVAQIKDTDNQIDKLEKLNLGNDLTDLINALKFELEKLIQHRDYLTDNLTKTKESFGQLSQEYKRVQEIQVIAETMSVLTSIEFLNKQLEEYEEKAQKLLCSMNASLELSKKKALEDNIKILE